MKFHRVIGKIDSKLIDKAETALSRVFLDLVLKPTNKFIGGSIGGDPLVFSLVYPAQHVATRNIPTAGTDGKRFYWNPKFVCSKSKLGLRIVCMHEAWHAIYMHPQRRGLRHPKLWNIAVDYIVNGTIMDDLRHRKLDPVSTFTKELGNFCTLPQYIAHLKNPLAKIPGSEHWIADKDEDEEGETITLPAAGDERELTEQEKKEVEKREAKTRYFFADPDLPDDMKRPERIYDLLFSNMPKCPKCGRLGVYVPPQDQQEQGEQNEDEKQDPAGEPETDEQDSQEQDEDNSHDHSDGDECCGSPDSSDHDDQGHGHDCEDEGDGDSDQPGSGQPGSKGKPSPGSGSQPGKGKDPCSACGGGHDIFGDGDTLDDHMDADESQDKMAKRLADAMEAAKRMAGSVPGSLEEELGELLAPKVKWQDFLRVKISKVRDGNAKNDWTRFRTRPLFAGIFIPKRINQICTFGCLLDTSGSMSKDDMAFGISQLQSIDERSEGWVVPADATIYWDKFTKLRRINPAEIKQVKVVGRGGTKYAEFFRDYKEKIGKADFLIIITDGGLLDTDIAEMVDPGVDVIWLITSGSLFKAPFGRVFDLKS